MGTPIHTRSLLCGVLLIEITHLPKLQYQPQPYVNISANEASVYMSPDGGLKTSGFCFLNVLFLPLI